MIKKIKVLTIIVFSAFIGFTQDFTSNGWIQFQNEKVQKFEISESCDFEIDNYTFYVILDDKLIYDKNENRYYPGIRSLKITNNGRIVNIIEGIVDKIGHGTIKFSFYDYNFDGYLDFTLPKDCVKSCYVRYYLFIPTENKFQHFNKWDYLRIQRINKEKKQILTQPDGTATDGWQKLYQVKGNELIELEKIVYGEFFKEIEK